MIVTRFSTSLFWGIAFILTVSSLGRLAQAESGNQEVSLQNSPPTMTLVAAIKANDVEEIKRHIDHGTPLDHPNQDGLTPLHFAAGLGKTEAIKALLAAGANVDSKRPC